jgi:hypothetical protein
VPYRSLKCHRVALEVCPLMLENEKFARTWDIYGSFLDHLEDILGAEGPGEPGVRDEFVRVVHVIVHREMRNFCSRCVACCLVEAEGEPMGGMAAGAEGAVDEPRRLSCPLDEPGASYDQN